MEEEEDNAQDATHCNTVPQDLANLQEAADEPVEVHHLPDAEDLDVVAPAEDEPSNVEEDVPVMENAPVKDESANVDEDLAVIVNAPFSDDSVNVEEDVAVMETAPVADDSANVEEDLVVMVTTPVEDNSANMEADVAAMETAPVGDDSATVKKEGSSEPCLEQLSEDTLGNFLSCTVGLLLKYFLSMMLFSLFRNGSESWV
jgi:hypothetical protein